MRMHIQTPDFKAPDHLIDFATRNVEKLNELSDRILEARVLLKVEKSSNNKDKVCELQLEMPGNDVFAYRRSSSFEVAIVEALGAAEHQIKRLKEAGTERQQRGLPKPPAEE